MTLYTTHFHKSLLGSFDDVLCDVIIKCNITRHEYMRKISLVDESVSIDHLLCPICQLALQQLTETLACTYRYAAHLDQVPAS